MREAASNMIKLGTPVPPFELRDYDQKEYSSDDFVNYPLLVIMFICNECPFVKHISTELSWLVKEYQPRGVAAVGINSSDFKAFPEENAAAMQQTAHANNYTFPYLIDSTQQAAKDFDAACTPDFFVFDQQQKLAYRGRMDGSRPDNQVALTGIDLRLALDDLLAYRPVSVEQKPATGSAIKWKPINQPALS